jgi:hypothetical protein
MFVALAFCALGQSFKALPLSVRAIVPTGHGMPGVISVPPFVHGVPLVGVTAIFRMYELPYCTLWLPVLSTGFLLESKVTKLNVVLLA